MILNIFLIGHQHFKLDLQHFVPEGQVSLGFGDELVASNFSLNCFLVLVFLSVLVLLNVPDSVGLVDVSVADHLKLFITPFSILFATEFQGLACVDVYETDLGVDGVPNVTSCFAVDNIHSPVIFCRHGDVVVNIAGHLLVVRRHRGGNVVGVESAVRHAVHDLNNVAVLDVVDGLGHNEGLPLRPLDDPPVVDVLECVTGYLLLVGRATAIFIPIKKTYVLNN